MGLWREFDTFDPLTGQVPHWPYSQLGGVAWRARSLLRGRKSEEIKEIARVASDTIDEYFKQAEDEEVARLRRDGQWDFLNIDSDGVVLGLNEERIDELEIPTPDNTSDLDALSESIGTFTEIFEKGIPDPEDFEYFAAVALWKVAEAIYKVNYEYDFKKREHLKKDRNKLASYDLTASGDLAIQAMEAVCHAEQLRDRKRINERFEERLKAEKKRTSVKVLRATEAKWKRIQRKEAKQKSEHARKMAAESLKNRNASRAAVLAEWGKDPALQKLSNAKAGLRLSQWLGSQDLEFFEPRTVSEWISAHKKTPPA